MVRGGRSVQAVEDYCCATACTQRCCVVHGRVLSSEFMKSLARATKNPKKTPHSLFSLGSSHLQSWNQVNQQTLKASPPTCKQFRHVDTEGAPTCPTSTPGRFVKPMPTGHGMPELSRPFSSTPSPLELPDQTRHVVPRQAFCSPRMCPHHCCSISFSDFHAHRCIDELVVHELQHVTMHPSPVLITKGCSLVPCLRGDPNIMCALQTANAELN